LVNAHATDSADVVVTFFPGVSGVRLKSWRVLAADDIRGHNSFDHPDRVTPRDMSSRRRSRGKIKLPPASVNVLTLVVND
jgi:alpha-L-arabinofuranosidase